MVVPVVGNVPLQPPDAVQVLALVAFHCSVTEAPMATVLSLAFKVTNGGATTADAAALLGVCVGCDVSDVTAFELAPHAASELSTANANIDFNANANRERWLRRIELIRVSPRLTATKFPRSSIPFTRNL